MTFSPSFEEGDHPGVDEDAQDITPCCACCLHELTAAEQAAPAVGGDRICVKCWAEEPDEPTVLDVHLSDAELIALREAGR